jgi:hypothetical protein
MILMRLILATTLLLAGAPHAVHGEVLASAIGSVIACLFTAECGSDDFNADGVISAADLVAAVRQLAPTETSTPNTPTATAPADTATVTPSATATLSRTQTPPPSPTISATATRTITRTHTPTPSPSPSIPPSVTPTPSRTATDVSTPTLTSTVTPSQTRTRTLTATATFSASPTRTSTLTRTATAPPSSTASPTPTVSSTLTATRTETRTATVTTTRTATRTATGTRTETPTRTATATATATRTPTATVQIACPDVESPIVLAPGFDIAKLLCSNQPQQTSDITDLALGPDGKLYFSLVGLGVLRTSDSVVEGVLPLVGVLSLAFDPPGNLYAGTGDGFVVQVVPSMPSTLVFRAMEAGATVPVASALRFGPNDNLFAGYFPLEGDVFEVDPATFGPMNSSSVRQIGARGVHDVAFDPNGRLHVASHYPLDQPESFAEGASQVLRYPSLDSTSPVTLAGELTLDFSFGYDGEIAIRPGTSEVYVSAGPVPANAPGAIYRITNTSGQSLAVPELFASGFGRDLSPTQPAGLTFGPGSTEPGQLSLYASGGGGAIWEIRGFGPLP